MGVVSRGRKRAAKIYFRIYWRPVPIKATLTNVCILARVSKATQSVFRISAIWSVICVCANTRLCVCVYAREYINIQRKESKLIR